MSVSTIFMLSIVTALLSIIFSSLQFAVKNDNKAKVFIIISYSLLTITFLLHLYEYHLWFIAKDYTAIEDVLPTQILIDCILLAFISVINLVHFINAFKYKK